MCTTVENVWKKHFNPRHIIKWHIYEKKKVESACQKTETIQSRNIYSFQTCDTFMKNCWNMLDRKKFNLTLLLVKCNVGKAVENAWKKMKWIPTFENLWFSTVKHTRQWLRDTDSLSVYTTSQLQSIWF